MVVKCTKTHIEGASLNIVNANMEDALQLGDIYTVYGLSIEHENIYYEIFYDERHLMSVPSSLFTIVDDHVPACWRVGFSPLGDLTLYPKLFYQEDFWENFSEFEEKERKQFEALRVLFEGPEAVAKSWLHASAEGYASGPLLPTKASTS